jgi:hypothetical protein
VTENVDVVRGVYDAWARGRFPGPEALLSNTFPTARAKAASPRWVPGSTASGGLTYERFDVVGERVAVVVR